MSSPTDLQIDVELMDQTLRTSLVRRQTKDPLLEQLTAYSIQKLSQPITLQDLALEAKLPANTLVRRFQRRYRQSPMRWVWNLRTLASAELIAAAPERSLIAIAKSCGFGSSAHFSRRFREIFGIAPSAYRALAQAGACRLAPSGSLGPRVPTADSGNCEGLTPEAIIAAAQRAAQRLETL